MVWGALQPFVLNHASKMLGPGQNRYDEAEKNPNPRTDTNAYLSKTPTGLVPTLVCPGAMNDVVFESSPCDC